MRRELAGVCLLRHCLSPDLREARPDDWFREAIQMLQGI
jgi:hypothetical protein